MSRGVTVSKPAGRWQDRELRVLDAHWREKSAAELAAMLPGRTRSAILGKLDRMGRLKGEGDVPPD